MKEEIMVKNVGRNSEYNTLEQKIKKDPTPTNFYCIVNFMVGRSEISFSKLFNKKLIKDTENLMYKVLPDIKHTEILK